MSGNTLSVFSWIPFNLIFLVLEFNESRNMLMKPLNAKSNGICIEPLKEKLVRND